MNLENLRSLHIYLTGSCFKIGKSLTWLTIHCRLATCHYSLYYLFLYLKLLNVNNVSSALPIPFKYRRGDMYVRYSIEQVVCEARVLYVASRHAMSSPFLRVGAKPRSRVNRLVLVRTRRRRFLPVETGFFFDRTISGQYQFVSLLRCFKV